METLLFIFDTGVILVVIYFSLRHERRPDLPEEGPFRLRVAPPPKAAPPPAPVKRRRGRMPAL